MFFVIVPSLVPIKNNVLQEQEVLNKIIQQSKYICHKFSYIVQFKTFTGFRNIVPKPTITSTNQNISAGIYTLYD